MALKSPRRGVQSIRRHHSAALGSFPLRSFYVDATLGNDANSGTYPSEAWQTVAKIGTTFIFRPGDHILFKRGETWTEALLRPKNNGIAGLPITLGAYGSGARPIIDATDIQTALYIDENRSYITIEDMEFRVNFDHARSTALLLAGANNIILRDCYVYGGNGIFGAAGTYDISILDSEVSHTRSNGMALFGARSIVRRCVVHDFGVSDTDLGGVKIYESGSVDSIVADCIIYNGTGTDHKGVYADLGGANCNAIFERNLIYNTTYGISTFESDGVIIRNNVIYDIDLGAGGVRPRGIGFAFSNNGFAYHNTVYNCPQALFIHNANNNVVKNNIFSECPSTPAVWVTGTGRDTHDIDNNDWHNVAQWRYGPGDFYNTLALWVAGTIYDDNSIDDDPVFVTPGTDHHIQVGSPCRGAGAIDTGVTDDYDGVARPVPPTRPDIGAYQFVP